MSDEDVEETFEEANDYRWYADVKLEAIGAELESLLEEAMKRVEFETDVDLNSGAIYFKQDNEQAIEWLNTQVEWPIVVSDSARGIRVKRVPTDLEDLELSTWEKDNPRKIIGAIEEQCNGGAPLQAILECGVTENDLEKLRRKGSVYEPTSGRYRVT